MKHDTTIIEGAGTRCTKGAIADASSVDVSEGMPRNSGARLGRKASVLLGLVIVAGLAAASVGFEATVAQAVGTQTENADGDGTRGGNRNHNRPREAGDGADGDRSSKGNRNRPNDTGENGEPTASDGR